MTPTRARATLAEAAVHALLAGDVRAAAELLGVATRPYHQKAYVTCLDLGDAGALFTRGWERKVEMVGDVAKKTKQEINTVWIYPPRPELGKLFAAAPAQVMDLSDISVPNNAAAA
jgi:NADH dehydrogenase FAD-containing subunit